MKKNLLLALAGLFCSRGVFAQQTIQLHNVSIDAKTGMPRWAEVSTDQQVTETAFFEWFKVENKLAPGIEFRLLRSDADNLGFVHNRYKQFFNGTEVMNALLIVHIKGGWVESFNGEYYRNFDQSIAGITAEAARDRLLLEYGKVIFRWQVPEEEAMLKKVTKK